MSIGMLNTNCIKVDSMAEAKRVHVGGWSGAHYAQKVDPRKLWLVVIAMGLIMRSYFFVSVYALDR
jgi:hypothetical protein